MRDRRYDSARWLRLRKAIIARDGGCVRSGCRVDTTGPRMLHVDHVVEVDDGGEFWDPWNLQTLCRTHHAAKTLAVMADSASEPSSEDW